MNWGSCFPIEWQRTMLRHIGITRGKFESFLIWPFFKKKKNKIHLRVRAPDVFCSCCRGSITILFFLVDPYRRNMMDGFPGRSRLAFFFLFLTWYVHLSVSGWPTHNCFDTVGLKLFFFLFFIFVVHHFNSRFTLHYSFFHRWVFFFFKYTDLIVSLLNMTS